MKKIVVFAIVLTLFGCTTRSISDSGYRSGHYPYRSDNPLYKGELSEFDVLGIDAGREITEQDIVAVADLKKDRLTLRRGDSILLIQSGGERRKREDIGLSQNPNFFETNQSRY